MPGETRVLQSQGGVILRLNDDRTLDEVIAYGATVHLEQMDRNLWWLGVNDVGLFLYTATPTSRGMRAGSWVRATVTEPSGTADQVTDGGP